MAGATPVCEQRGTLGHPHRAVAERGDRPRTIVVSSQVREVMMKEVRLDGEVEVTVEVRAHDKAYIELTG